MQLLRPMLQLLRLLQLLQRAMNPARRAWVGGDPRGRQWLERDGGRVRPPVVVGPGPGGGGRCSTE